MLTLLDLAQEDTQFSQKASTRREKKGPCPGCGGTDRFCIKVDSSGNWSFMCRGCWDAQEVLSPEMAQRIGKPKRVGERRGFGDVIDYLRHYRNMGYKEARDYLGSEEGGSYHREIRPARASNWQEVIGTSVKECEARLWQSEDTTALDYIRGRGLREQTIKGAHIGYSVKDGIPRLIVPSYNDEHYVTVYMRDLRPDIERPWRDIKGGSKDELYLADSLRVKRPTVLVESPLCALTLAQECAGMINAVATGGTDGARSPKSLAQLALMPLVFVAFDADTAGDENSHWWLKRLPRSKRLRPYLKDINAMLIDRWDIRAWIGQSIQREPLSTSVSTSTEEIPQEYLDALENEEYYCSECLEIDIDRMVRAVEMVGDTWYCEAHLPTSAKWERAGFDQRPDGTLCLPGSTKKHA